MTCPDLGETHMLCKYILKVQDSKCYRKAENGEVRLPPGFLQGLQRVDMIVPSCGSVMSGENMKINCCVSFLLILLMLPYVRARNASAMETEAPLPPT